MTYDVFLGEGKDRVNLGLIFSRYNGGITKINNNVGSSWDNSYSAGYGRYGNSWVRSTLGQKAIVIHFELMGLPHEYIDFKREMASAVDCPDGPRKLSFNNEPDLYYNAVVSGSIELDESVSEYKASGSITFDVPDGIAHSSVSKVLNKNTTNPDIGSYEVTSTTSIKMVLNNQGSTHCWPVIRVNHKNSDNGYIGIVTSFGGLMEIGSKAATTDGAMMNTGTLKSETLVNIGAGDSSSTTGWGLFKDASTTYKESPIANSVCIKGGKMRYAFNNVGYSSKGLEWDRTGTNLPGYKWSGGISELVIPADSNNEVGATNWRADFNIKVWEKMLGMSGYLSIIFADSAGRNIAAYDIAKDDTSGNNIYAKFKVGENWKQLIKFGANNGEANQTNKNVAFNNGKGGAYIIKDGAKFTFGYNGLPHSFTDSALEGKVVSKIIITSGRLQNEAAGRGFISKLMVETLKFTKNNTKRYDLVPNKFTKNTAVEVDMYDGQIFLYQDAIKSTSKDRINDQLVLDSDFLMFPKGPTTVEMYFSSWVTQTPEVSIEWNESYL